MCKFDMDIVCLTTYVLSGCLHCSRRRKHNVPFRMADCKIPGADSPPGALLYHYNSLLSTRCAAFGSHQIMNSKMPRNRPRMFVTVIVYLVCESKFI